MNIYLSVNNREEVIKLPVVPSSFTVSKPQGGAVVETVSGAELSVIGAPRLKSITIDSFFPKKDYPFSRSEWRSASPHEYVYLIDTWIQKKLPIRLVITETPINMAVRVTDFEYTIGTDGDVYYKLELAQYNLLGYDNPSPIVEWDAAEARE